MLTDTWLSLPVQVGGWGVFRTKLSPGQHWWVSDQLPCPSSHPTTADSHRGLGSSGPFC